MAEKNILSYFKSPEEAEGAARKLQALRVEHYAIDRFSRYGGTAGSGISGLGLHSDLTIRSAHILSGADPSLSGMSDGGQGGPTGRDILLTVVVSEDRHPQAIRIVEEAGGLI